MEYRRLGDSGLFVSPICLGTMMFGSPTDETTSGQIIGSARNAGINFIDTANVYVKGVSEEITGKFIREDRDRWILATKVGSPMGDGPSEKSNSRKRIMTEAEASLRRLGTDYIDVYYLHRDDLETPLEEPISAMSDLIRQGKVRYWGFSNFSAWRIGALILACEAVGAPKPVVTQPCYNAMNRMLEQEFLPACAHFGIGVVPYSPLARGVLTGKYPTSGPAPEGSRAGRKDALILNTEYRKESLAFAQKIKKRAEKQGTSAGQLALNWVLNNAIVTSVIAGPRTMEQWTDYLDALSHPFTARDEAFFDKMVPSGFNSTPFFGDPKLPPRGRLPRNQ